MLFRSQPVNQCKLEAENVLIQPDLEVEPLAVTVGVEVRSQVELIVGVGDLDSLLQVARLEPALEQQGLRGQVGPDGLGKGRGGATAGDRATEIVDLVARLVMVHHDSMLLSKRSRLCLLACNCKRFIAAYIVLLTLKYLKSCHNQIR